MYLFILNNTYNKKQVEEILKILDGNGFSEQLKERIIDYIEDRNERNSKMTVKSLKIFIEKILSIGNEEYVIKLLEESIISGWKSIFPDKLKSKKDKEYQELTEKDFEEFSKGGLKL